MTVLILARDVDPSALPITSALADLLAKGAAPW